jgi:hypothetical protein
MASSQDTEITLGTAKLLGLFLAWSASAPFFLRSAIRWDGNLTPAWPQQRRWPHCEQPRGANPAARVQQRQRQ